MERPNDKWLRQIIIPILVLAANLIYWGQYDSLWVYLGWSVVGVLYVQIVWEWLISWLMRVRQRYPDFSQTRQRVAFTFLGYIVITALSQALFVPLLARTAWVKAELTAHDFLMHFVIGSLAVFVVGALYEIQYYLQKYREAIQEAEIVKKICLQSDYDNLKNQINPHFLFNSLNTLSALIPEDKQRASQLLDEMSSVYRYLLQAGQRPFVTLQAEVAFIRSFLHVLEARYGKALRWQVTVSDALTDYQLPSLTLQTLVENALRHNVLLADQPLTIRIHTTSEGCVEVSNNVQRKTVQVHTQSGGLGDLAARYKSLQLPQLVISDDDEFFTVRLAVVPKRAADVLVNAA